MATEQECVCCQEIPEVLNRLYEEYGDDAHQKCITQHPGFEAIALNPHNLRAVYWAYRQQYNPNRQDPQHE